ncbi:MAG: bifunctional precorrin-2 dehydrogenase/sirohydrochlorin ferrochelatase [Bacteroidota bacterium]
MSTATTKTQQATATNPLYPIFLKVHQLQVLIVGAGEVGLEKLSFMLKSSPDAQVTMIAPEVSEEIRELLTRRDYKVRLIERVFEPEDVIDKDLIIAATNNRATNEVIRKHGKAHGKLVNVADTPDLCDFYLGAIVTRGNLKVAISTNGKSPTFAKRFRQLLEEVLPEDVNELLNNLRSIRQKLVGDFAYKVKKLNEITAGMLDKEPEA